MTYELALKLKEAGFPQKGYMQKVCRSCEQEYIGGNKSFRCKPCQKKARLLANVSWQKKYYDANKERVLARQKGHQQLMRKTNEEFRQKELLKYHIRQARIRGNGGKFTLKEWTGIKEKFDNRCAICLEAKKLTVDHIIPLSKGGKNSADNIQPLCGSCNSRKRDKIYAH